MLTLNLKKEFYIKLVWISLFAIAMGYLETSVVVYLRKLYFPTGLKFPPTKIDSSTGVVEFWREMATIVMLLGAGMIAGRNRNEKFAWFIYCFAIWDIFYYVFLRMLLGWPESLMDWDVLFLIPVPWFGPVLAPCIIAISMITMAMIIVVMEEKGIRTKIDARSKIFAAAGCFVCIVSFCWDYCHHAAAAGKMWTPGSDDALFGELQNYIPKNFNWGMFFAGEALIAAGIVRVYRESLKSSDSKIIAKVLPNG
jgi:hypothetical protein